MPAIVNSVNLDSIAQDLDIKKGDEIISINEVKPKDLLDYQYIIASEEISLHIKRVNGEEEIIDIEKDFEDDLGITFESAVFDRIIPCANKCVFCFVDQQPKGLRNSLYVKEDDYRLTHLQGTYVTLTNLTQAHKNRIANLGLGPLYVSVHTTNPKLRAQMLRNPKAQNIMKNLKWLNDIDIPIHTQIVLCPGINDGKELEHSLKDLGSLQNNMSIAVVPVGISKYREKSILNKVTKEKAIEVISQIAEFNKSIGRNLAFASDVFYILAQEDFPVSAFYSGFGQMNDGVGVCRLLMDDFNRHKNILPEIINKPKHYTIATGKIACNALQPMIIELNKIKNLQVNLKPIKSYFWGDDVTVAGLITGEDLIKNLAPQKNELSNLIIPSVMVRDLTDEFLDDLKISDVQENLSTPISVIQDYYSCKELLNLIKSD